MFVKDSFHCCQPSSFAGYGGKIARYSHEFLGYSQYNLGLLRFNLGLSKKFEEHHRNLEFFLSHHNIFLSLLSANKIDITCILPLFTKISVVPTPLCDLGI